MRLRTGSSHTSILAWETTHATKGLGLVDGGLRLGAGQEVLTTPHGHYATLESLRLRAERTGAVVREVALYHEAARASVDDIVTRMRDGVHGLGIEDVTMDELGCDFFIANTSPYPVSYARLAPSIINDEEEVERSVDAVAALG